MASVLLTILKIVGIILLVILCLVLLILALVLFVPFRYRAQAVKPELPPGSPITEGLEAEAGVTWLLHLVSLRIGFAEGKLFKSLKIAGIDLLKNKKPKEKKPKEPKGQKSRPLSEIADKKSRKGGTVDTEVLTENASEPEAPAVNMAAAEQEASSVTEPVEEPPAPAAEEEAASASDTESPSCEEEPLPETKEPKRFGRKKCFSDFCWHIAEKIYNALYSLWKKIANLIEKLRRLKETADKWLGFLEEERTQMALDLTWRQLKKILKGILPKKCRGYVHYGSEDPYKTGKTLSYLAACYPLYGRSLQVVPDFQEKALDGDLDIRGRIFLSTIAFAALRVYFNKNVKYVINFLKNKGDKEAA